MKFTVFAVIVFLSVVGTYSVSNLNENIKIEFTNMDYFAYAEDKTQFQISPNYSFGILEKTQDSSHKIPSWIKSNAGWWADGQIDDSSFLEGIQFLIKERMLKIPATSHGPISSSSEIPSWIKDNARWWAEDSIDDASFVGGIQFLIKEGIMVISS